MAEPKLQLTADGQAVLQSDFNQLGLVSGLADDRVFAELLRMTPNTGSVAKGVLPYGYAGASNPAFIVPNGASGSCLVNPFRAFVGSRTAAATDGKLSWRDIRSGLSVLAGSTALTQVVNFAANASGNPRWDAVYAVVVVDANSATVVRKVKSPTTSIVADTNVSVTQNTTVTLAVATGVTGASPAFPAIPADADPTYNILLGYVRIPTGFTAGSTVATKDINERVSILSISRSMGASTLRPANQHNVSGGTAISSAGTSTENGILAWTGTTATRPGLYMPPSMSGSDGLLVAIDAGNASSANWSHADGAVVDDSRDWRDRAWRWSAMIGAGGGVPGRFPWSGSVGTMLSPADLVSPVMSMPGYAVDQTYPTYASGMGSSFHTGGTKAIVAALLAKGAGSVSAPANGANVSTYVLASGAIIYLYVEISTGILRVGIVGTPLAAAFFWIEATAPYGNQ